MALFDDAQTDAADLAELVNGTGFVTTRYGDNPKRSWQQLQDEFDETQAGEYVAISVEAADRAEAAADAVLANQPTGVIVFTTYALLDAYTPADTDEQKASYKVTNDPDSSLNGYYHWVSGTAYEKDADLVINTIDVDNTSDAVSGQAVALYVDSHALSYPFSKDTDYLVNTQILLSNAIIDVYVNSTEYSEFFIYRVSRNDGVWEVQIRPTANPASNVYGRLYVGTNPETGGDVVDVHDFTDGEIAGRVAINWSKLPDGFQSGVNSDAEVMVLDGTISDPLDKNPSRALYIPKVESSVFTPESQFKGLSGTFLPQAIVDIRCDGEASDFYIYRIKRNYGGEWEVQVRASSGTLGYGRFYSATNPETGGDAVDVHEFNSTTGITGSIAINWSLIPDGYYSDAIADADTFRLSPTVADFSNNSLLNEVTTHSLSADTSTFSNFLPTVSLNRDRVFSYYDIAGVAKLNIVGLAMPGKVIAMEFSNTVTGIELNVGTRITSGVFDNALLAAYSNYVYIMYVSDNLVDIVYKQGASTRAQEHAAIPVDTKLSFDKKTVTVEFSKQLNPSSFLLTRDFTLTKNTITSVNITENYLVFTTLLPVSENNVSTITYTHTSRLLDIDGLNVSSFSNVIDLPVLLEEFAVDPIDNGSPYNWITYGDVVSHSSDGDIFTMTADSNSGLRISSLLGTLAPGSLIEVRYRCTSGNTPLSWFSEGSAFETFSADSITVVQDEWVIARRIYNPLSGPNPNFILVSPSDNVTFEFDYIRILK